MSHQNKKIKNQPSTKWTSFPVLYLLVDIVQVYLLQPAEHLSVCFVISLLIWSIAARPERGNQANDCEMSSRQLKQSKYTFRISQVSKLSLHHASRLQQFLVLSCHWMGSICCTPSGYYLYKYLPNVAAESMFNEVRKVISGLVALAPWLLVMPALPKQTSCFSAIANNHAHIYC